MPIHVVTRAELDPTLKRIEREGRERLVSIVTENDDEYRITTELLETRTETR